MVNELKLTGMDNNICSHP